MINRRQLFVLASGAVMFAGARGANAAQLTNAQKTIDACDRHDSSE